MTINHKIFAVIFLVLTIQFSNPPAFAIYPNFEASQNLLADRYFRTELYFGTDIPGGGKVSDEDWDKFLEREVTPRFPQGFTVLAGYGQYKDSSEKIVRESSRILVLFYPKKQREAVNIKIEELRESYKKLFKQESVLRLDFVKSVNVKF